MHPYRVCAILSRTNDSNQSKVKYAMNIRRDVVPTKPRCVSNGAVARAVSVVFLGLGLAACASLVPHPTVETPTAAPVVTSHAHQADLASSYANYARGNESAALATLDTITRDPQSSAAATRNAHLAEALIRVNGAPTVRDTDAARAALQSAVALDAQAGADPMTQYLAKAIDAALTAHTHTQQLQSQARQLGRDKTDLRAQNDELTAQQAKLKAALEKLKQVTLGN